MASRIEIFLKGIELLLEAGEGFEVVNTEKHYGIVGRFSEGVDEKLVKHFEDYSVALGGESHEYLMAKPEKKKKDGDGKYGKNRIGFKVEAEE